MLIVQIKADKKSVQIRQIRVISVQKKARQCIRCGTLVLYLFLCEYFAKKRSCVTHERFLQRARYFSIFQTYLCEQN
jgi:hypothetical protein